MSQLLRAEPERVLAVRQRAAQCCISFVDEPMPSGASQPTGRVGIEVDPTTGRALLHVERGIAYVGPVQEIAAWFESGTKTFGSYKDLLDWLEGPLAEAYGDRESSGRGRSSSDPGQQPEPTILDTGQVAELLSVEVVGQSRSIEQVASAAALHLARCSPRRPLTVLALGPTGVGKTLMAESLASAIAKVSGQACDYLRLDMTEFQERHSVAKLLGAPPGYIGFGEEPRLVSTLRAGRRSVVLIDEIEKAHPDVFLSIMNLMDAGRLTPATGEPVDARHAILMFTTNLGAEELANAIAASSDVPLEPVDHDALVRRTLRLNGIAPELVGRLHELLVFDPLGDDDLDEVLRRSITREAETFGLSVVSVVPQVLEELRSHRPDPGSGVRVWEHLISVEIGPVFLEACRLDQTGELALLHDPTRLEIAEPSGSVE